MMRIMARRMKAAWCSSTEANFGASEIAVVSSGSPVSKLGSFGQGRQIVWLYRFGKSPLSVM